MIFVESPWFSDWRDRHLADEIFYRLLVALIDHPEAGALIPGGRGLRKIRVAMSGRGKRGGARVIYFYRSTHARILLLHGYAKNAQDDLSNDQLKRLSATIEEELGNG